MPQETAWKQTIRFDVADAAIPSKQCVSLSLVVNELVTNALKHGKSSAELTLTVQGSHIVLEICDDGPGFSPEFNVLSGAKTGLELVESLVVTDLQGEAYFANSLEGGARVRVVFSLPN
jgi:two-component sensor histidine kinase